MGIACCLQQRVRCRLNPQRHSIAPRSVPPPASTPKGAPWIIEREVEERSPFQVERTHSLHLIPSDILGSFERQVDAFTCNDREWGLSVFQGTHACQHITEDKKRKQKLSHSMNNPPPMLPREKNTTLMPRLMTPTGRRATNNGRTIKWKMDSHRGLANRSPSVLCHSSKVRLLRLLCLSISA